MTSTTILLAGKDEIRRLVDLAKRTGHPDRYAAKRKSPRIKGALWMQLSFDPAAEQDTLPVTAYDISARGVSFWLRKKLEVGATLFVRDGSDEQPHPWLKARVTHCTSGLKGFLTGCAFEAP